MLVLNICLSDIPLERVTISKKNNKQYIKLVVREMTCYDDYGNTHNVIVSQRHKDDTSDLIYVGRGKAYNKFYNNRKKYRDDDEDEAF